MLRFFVSMIFVAGLSAAPSPSYSSLILSPTSRVEQHFMLLPQRQQPYQAQPHDIRPYSELKYPKQQVFYYNPQQHDSNLRQPLVNLYELRQDLPWYQQYWNQYVGQGSQGEEEQEAEQVISSEEIDEENKNKLELQAVSANQYVGQGSQGEEEQQAERVISSEEIDEENKNKLELQAVSANQYVGQSSENKVDQQVRLESSPENIVEENKNKLDLEAISANQPQSEKEETNKIEPRDAVEAKNLVPLKELDQQMQQIPATDSSANEQQNDEPSQLLHRYYLINGPAEFYGNIDPASTIVSLQPLQPVVRSDDDHNSAQQKITAITTTTESESTSIPTTTSEPSSTLRIYVVDDDDAKEEEKIIDESEQVIARSQLPSVDQNMETSEDEEDKSSRGEAKSRESSETEGRADDYSIAQAKPVGTAIAGEGGVASSKPVATAITGPNGLSVASPVATAVAGDFLFNDDDDRKQKPMKTKPRRPIIRNPTFYL